MGTKIYVCMYNPDDLVLKIKDPIYVPIQCGKKSHVIDKNNHQFLPELGDDTGDNISDKNTNYSELTASYWVWKNDTSNPDDIVGINHYRRYFAEPARESEEENDLLTESTIKELLQDAEFIVYGIGTNYGDLKYDLNYGRTGYAKDSAYDNYKTTHRIEDLDNALICVQKLFPDLYDKINYYVRYDGGMCLCNMLICRKKHFDQYCEFIFSVFKMLEDYIDFSADTYQGYYRRVFGFLAERLFRPWLIARGFRARQGRGLDWEKYSGYTWA